MTTQTLPRPRAPLGGARSFLLSRTGLITVRVALLVLLLGAWEWAARAGVVDAFFLGQPSAVWSAFRELVASGQLGPHAWATLTATLWGFLIGSALGIAAGFLLSAFPYLDRLCSPAIAVLNSMPRIALAPLFIIWFGLTTWSKVWLAVSIVLFILMLNTRSGLHLVDRNHQTLARVMEMGRWTYFRKVLLPSAAPPILAGLRLAVVYALLGVIASEMVASRDGLGQLAVRASARFDVGGLLAVLLVVAVIAAVLNLVLDRLERLMIARRLATRAD